MLAELDNRDWEGVFQFANGKPNLIQNLPGFFPDPAVPGSRVSCAPFDRDDVARIIAMDDGEGAYFGDPEQENWAIAVALRDGRFGAIRAGCDRTGWD